MKLITFISILVVTITTCKGNTLRGSSNHVVAKSDSIGDDTINRKKMKPIGRRKNVEANSPDKRHSSINDQFSRRTRTRFVINEGDRFENPDWKLTCRSIFVPNTNESEDDCDSSDDEDCLTSSDIQNRDLGILARVYGRNQDESTDDDDDDDDDSDDESDETQTRGGIFGRLYGRDNTNTEDEDEDDDDEEEDPYNLWLICVSEDDDDESMVRIKTEDGSSELFEGSKVDVRVEDSEILPRFWDIKEARMEDTNTLILKQTTEPRGETGIRPLSIGMEVAFTRLQFECDDDDDCSTGYTCKSSSGARNSVRNVSETKRCYKIEGTICTRTTDCERLDESLACANWNFDDTQANKDKVCCRATSGICNSFTLNGETCENDENCEEGYYCSRDSICEKKKKIFKPCRRDAECQNGSCSSSRGRCAS